VAAALDVRRRIRAEAALRDLDPKHRERLLAEIANLIVGASLSNNERSQLFTELISTMGLSGNELRELAIVVSSAPPPVKNALAGAMPRSVLPILFHRSSQAESRPLSEPTEVSEEAVPLSERVDLRISQAEQLATEAESAGTVRLPAVSDNQAANRSLLNRIGIGSTRVSNVGEIDRLLKHGRDIVAVVIDGSFFLEVNEKESQDQLFRNLAAYSNFIWLRVDSTNLQFSANELQAILKDAWCEAGDISVNRLLLAPGSSISKPELDYVKAPSRVLSTIDRGRFLPGELSNDQAATLMAAAAKHGRNWQEVTAPESLDLRIEFLQGGRTGAKVALLEINGQGVPLVAKIGNRSSILDEIRRFRTFIHPWDHKLQPAVHIHADCGIIVLGLVAEDDSPINPAPTLERRLTDLWKSELYEPWEGLSPPDPPDLKRAIKSATDKLLRLNRRTCTEGRFENYSNPFVDGLVHLEDSNIRMGFSEDARQARQTATERFRRLSDRAVVHGDEHLRNILIVDDRLAYLIDYAYSGPGHPAIDLARLELSLYLGAFQQAGSHDECLAFQNALSVELRESSLLHQQFPELARLKTNWVCIEGCVMARDAAIKAVTEHGGDQRDYLSAKLLLAWYSLSLGGLNTGLARGIIDVISEQVMGWGE
jgi:Ternary complex associated domain 9